MRDEGEEMRVLIVLALLIVYGSLYPGDFATPATGAIAALFADWRWFTSLSDVLGNVALFIPLGLVGVLRASNKRDAVANDAWLLFLSFVFALLLQVAQLWLPSRSAALADVVWNVVGVAIGIVLGRLMGKRSSAEISWLHSTALVPLAILSLWLLTELLPLVPALDWQKFKDAVKPLLLEFDLSFPATLLHAAGVMVAGSALIALGRRPSGWLAVALLLLVTGKVAIVNLTLDASMLIGWVAGYVACILLANKGTKIFELTLLLLLAAWSITTLTPFLPEPGGVFNAIPFATMLRGSMETSVQGLIQSLFIYSALLWLVQRLRGNLAGATVGLAIWSSMLELTQMGLLGRTADVTEPLLVFLAGWGLSLAARHAAAPSSQTQTKSPAQRQPLPLPVRELSRQRWWLFQGLSVFCLATLIWGALRLPGIPYNLRELFLGGGNFFFVLIFALALLWLGGGAQWVANKIVVSKRPYFSLPVWVLVVSLISLILLSMSVTQESLDDIAGSNNLYWFVTNRNIWGEGWRTAFMLVGPDVVGVFERIGRFAALYSPPLIFLALILSFFQLQMRAALTAQHSILLLASALPWLWLSKAVAFDWSSTDNLNELIARDGPMGWGGGAYLYALLGLLCVNAALLGYVRKLGPIFLVMVLSVAALPLGWWLLNLGLEAKVEKYDLVFSGAQFLLGQDRAHVLSEMSLFARWCVLQIGFVAVVALGIGGARLNPYRVLQDERSK